jgi:hypothetical protein
LIGSHSPPLVAFFGPSLLFLVLMISLNIGDDTDGYEWRYSKSNVWFCMTVIKNICIFRHI